MATEGVLVNRSLCWQRFTVPQLLAQALFAKECQELPCSQAGISEQYVSQTLLVSSCGLFFSALLRSSQASPPCTYSHSHIVFRRHAVPGGHWRGTDLLPRRQAQILHYPTTDSALGRRAPARRQRGTRPMTAALYLGLG